MKDFPNAFWAGLFICMAVVLAVIALMVPTQANVTMAVVAIASNIVSGSFGYISGHRDGQNSVQVPLSPTSTTATTTTVSVGPTSDPTKPVDPAQPKQGS